MYGLGLKVSYLKDGQIIVSAMNAWQHHSTFTEIYLDNGDIIIDHQVIEYTD